MKNKLFPRIFFALLLAAVSVGVIGQQTVPQLAPDAQRLRQHVSYLASDALEGRRTGTPGANDAAHYIAGEFSRLGLRPAVQTARAPRSRGEASARFLQNFPYVTGVELGKGNELSAKLAAGASVNLRVSKDWMPLGLSANGRLANIGVTFVGYGMTVAELNYNDYTGTDVSGKIAVAIPGTPEGDNPHSKYARYEDVRWKAIAARAAGAKALVVIARVESFGEGRFSRLRYDNSAGDAGLPVLVISTSALPQLLGATAPSISELEQAAKTGVKSINLGNGTITVATDIVRREVAATNVIGILEGADPTLKNEAIVIGAHYDHLGRGGDGSLAMRPGEVHHGADDNASGVAGVLELARILVTERPRPRRTVVFIAFSGEEEGLLGSNFYVNHPIVSLTNTVAMINMDMIGRMKNNKLIIGGVGTATEWRPVIEAANLLPGMIANAGSSTTQTISSPVAGGSNRGRASGNTKQFQLTLNEDGYGPSDHSSFYAKGIPVLFFWTGTHADYHKPSDTAEKINYEDEARILNLVARVIRNIDANAKRPTFSVTQSQPTARSTGFRVYLGTMPNYADTNGGLLLDGVRDDSPAAKAGLKAGDRIVKLAGREVRDVYEYTYTLGEMQAGQEYEVEIVREGVRLKLKLTPAARK